MLEVVNHKIQDGRRNVEEVGLHESLKPKKIGKLGRAELRLADCESWCSSEWLIGTMQETLQVKLHVIMSAHFAYWEQAGTHSLRLASGARLLVPSSAWLGVGVEDHYVSVYGHKRGNSALFQSLLLRCFGEYRQSHLGLVIHFALNVA